MTEPHDDETRPISVAELLARNGTIGAPPVGGRRRLRRGNTEAVTVAELTGEIPIVGADVNGAAEADTSIEPDVIDGDGRPDVADELLDEAADEADALEEEGSLDPAGADEPFDDARLRLDDGRFASAEEMAPDAIDVDDEPAEADSGTATERDDDEVPSYLHATPDPLFGGPTPHRDRFADGDTVTLGALSGMGSKGSTVEDYDDAEPPSPAQRMLSGTLVVAQSILAVAFGAGLFIAFDQLWKWNTIVALVLSVLVILGLVAAVWVVRKTEDIASTLIAVAVGALVTMGPLVLHTN
ncbi:MAG: hypothetical protein QOH60_4397 [Mycobacterium sp.]|nr:hypothetical protein [Mycobacterium sp.]